MQADWISLCDNIFSLLFLDLNVGETSNKAVLEAKRWFQEKKSASNSKNKVSSGNSSVLLQMSLLKYLVFVL